MRGGPGTRGAHRHGFHAPVLLGLLLMLPLPCALAVPGMAPGAASGAGPAEQLLGEAMSLIAEGNWAGALEVLDLARSLDGTDSDMRMLAATALDGSGASLLEVIAEIDAGLAAGRFRSGTRFSALVMRADVLQRLGRPREALAALAEAGGTGLSPASILDPFAAVVSASCRRDLGERELFVAEIGRALARFPRDARFARLLLQSIGRQGDAAVVAERAAVDLVIRRLPSYAETDPELRVLAAPAMSSPQARRDAVLAYRSQGGSSPAATLRALEYGIIDGVAAVDEAFSTALPIDAAFLPVLDSLLGTGEARAALAERLASFTGTMVADRDGDLVVEERYGFSDGQLRSWTVDRDRDRIADLNASFEPFLMGIFLDLAVEGGRLGLRYGDFPAVSRAELLEGEDRTLFDFTPDALLWEAFSLLGPAPASAPGFLIPRRSTRPAPTVSTLAAAAWFITVEGPDGERREIEIEAGLPLRSRGFVGELLRAELVYDRGRPTRELVDADGDGRFETERFHDPAGAGDDGSVIAVAVDADGDGIFEYREETRSPFRKEWDFDADGAMDAVQTSRPDGAIVRSFSSRLDGRFDETIVLRDGRILSLTRDGVSPPLFGDSNPSLRWIGSKLFDMGGNQMPAEGLFRHMDRRYRIIQAGTEAFAEPVP